MAKQTDPDWIEHMHMDKGALHREMHIPAGKHIPEKDLDKGEESKNPTERKRSHLAEELEEFRQ